MADSGEPRLRTRASSRIAPVSAAAPDAFSRLLAEPDYTDDLREYLAPILPHWKLLVSVTIIAALAAYLFSARMMTRWYHAIAIIKPMTPQQTAGHFQGLLGSANLGSLSDLVGNQYNADAAQEYITILTSFSFVTAMVEHHHLAPELLSPDRVYPDADAQTWALYRIMLARLQCEYSVKNSSIALSFEDPDRERARRILEFAIDDLREKLRMREVRNAADAVASLQERVGKISDTLLVREIYELIAAQIQRQQLAEIQADFAFEVLQPPVTPDLPVRPRRTINALAAAFITLMIFAFAILILDSRRGSETPRVSSVEQIARKSSF